MDKIAIALTDDGALRVYAAVTTELVNKACKLHKTSPVASAALGRTLTAAAIMGAMEKNEKTSVTVQFKGGGPLGTVLAVSNAKSEVRGYVGNPEINLPLNDNGKLDVGGAVGKDGFLCIAKDFGSCEPYCGQVQLVSGEIAEDITSYYATSEQTPTAVALGVLIDTDLSVKASGGYVIQLMPGYSPDDENTISVIEKQIATLPSISKMVENGMTAEEIASAVMGELKHAIIGETIPKYKCNCSRNRVERALISIGKKDLESLINDNGTEVACHFCDKVYKFRVEELEKLADKCKI